MVLEINPEDVMTWETKKLWNTLNTLKNDLDLNIDMDIYTKCKFGIRIGCPVWYFTEEWYEIYPSSRKVKIVGYGKFWLKDFMQEKEDRDSLMRNLIIDNINEDGMIEGRV